MGIIRKIKTNFSSFEEIELFIQIFLLVTILPLLVRFLSIPKLMKVLTPGGVKIYESHKQEKMKDKIVKFTDYILSRNLWIYRTICLKRSLVLYHFLRKIGITVHICFGVRLPNKESKDKLEGHAWLLYYGDIYLEKNVEMTRSYKITYSFPEVNGQEVF